jgi:hypothetical protein
MRTGRGIPGTDPGAGVLTTTYLINSGQAEIADRLRLQALANVGLRSGINCGGVPFALLVEMAEQNHIAADLASTQQQAFAIC